MMLVPSRWLRCQSPSTRLLTWVNSMEEFAWAQLLFLLRESSCVSVCRVCHVESEPQRGGSTILPCSGQEEIVHVPKVMEQERVTNFHVEEWVDIPIESRAPWLLSGCIFLQPLG